MSNIHVGDEVRLSAQGKRCYSDNTLNPHYLTGIVTDTESYSNYGYHTTVTWSNSECNSYRDGEIELVKPCGQRKRKGYGQWLRALESSGVR